VHPVYVPSESLVVENEGVEKICPPAGQFFIDRQRKVSPVSLCLLDLTRLTHLCINVCKSGPKV